MTGPPDTDQGALVPMDIDVRPDQFDAIEAIARQTGVDRSAVVRRLLDLGLASSCQSDTEEGQR